MKICCAVCEYNPLHNGHVRHLEAAKRELTPDYTVIIMSGNFTQRGEIAVLDKFTRAKHAVMAGADAVFELPAVFATANAEIFAKGAIKLLKELPGEKTLCFGSESGNETSFLHAAKILSDESKEFKKLLKSQLNEGVSLAKAKTSALEQLDLGVDLELLKSPNNILGIEYARAITELDADMDIYPVTRSGAGYKDDNLYSDLSSATAIRKALKEGKKKSVKHNVPKFVYADLPEVLPNADIAAFYSLLVNDKKQLKGILDCTEGLENRIKSCLKDSYTLDALKEKVTTKRYTATRINRIITASLLNISENFVRKCLKSELYLNVLAVKEGRENLLAEIRKNCKIPLITRKNDLKNLKSAARDCFEKDVLANDIFNYLANVKTNEYMMLKI